MGHGGICYLMRSIHSIHPCCPSAPLWLWEGVGYIHVGGEGTKVPGAVAPALHSLHPMTMCRESWDQRAKLATMTSSETRFSGDALAGTGSESRPGLPGLDLGARWLELDSVDWKLGFSRMKLNFP